MQISRVVAGFLTLLVVVAFNPFKSTVRVAPTLDERDDLEFHHKIDPTALLEVRSRKSEIYTKAMIELKRLEEEPFCHRLAAQLLMNNCRDVKDMSDEDSQLRMAQNHHVESFANGLTLCDLARGNFMISEACSPFTFSALSRAYRNGKGKLGVTPRQTTACIEALAKDHSQWLTWVKHRDNALMFCRAVRLDIDKDETIVLHKELTRLMADLAEGLKDDLAHLRNSVAEQSRDIGSYFQEVRAGAELVTIEFKDQVKGFTNEAQRSLKTLVDTIMQDTTKVVAKQEHTLATTTELANSHLAKINMLAEQTSATLEHLNRAVDKLNPTLTLCGEKQDALLQKFDVFSTKIGNASNLIDDHSEILEQVSVSAKEILFSLKTAAAAAESLNETLSLSGSLGDWAIRICIPLASVFVGSHGLPPTLARNAFLALVGYMVAETIVFSRHSDWDEWGSDSSSPFSLTHLGRRNTGPSFPLVPLEQVL